MGREQIGGEAYRNGFSDGMNRAHSDALFECLDEMTPQERAKTLLEWGATPPDILDDFVDYLIKANCNGCDLCDPRLGPEWKPNFACCEEGRAKWFLAMKDEFRESRKEQK